VRALRAPRLPPADGAQARLRHETRLTWLVLLLTALGSALLFWLMPMPAQAHAFDSAEQALKYAAFPFANSS
jgi:hypothetical protein